MVLKKLCLGAGGALVITAATAAPAWAWNPSDAGLKLTGACVAGKPAWAVTNPNIFSVPFKWTDNKGGHSIGFVMAPAGDTVVMLPTHAASVTVVAYNSDFHPFQIWQKHGAAGIEHCAAAVAPPVAPPKKHVAAHKPVAKTPSHTAPPATPVKKQPAFTG